MGGVLVPHPWVEVVLIHTVPSQDEEPPALPPRTLEGLQLEEEPVYEVEPEPEPQPQPQPQPKSEPEPETEPETENDYEDIGDMDRCEQDGDPDGDYEDVLEPENPSFASTMAGEWGVGGGRSSSCIGSSPGEGKRKRNSPTTQKDLFSFSMLVRPCLYFSSCRIIWLPSWGWSRDLSDSPV